MTKSQRIDLIKIIVTAIIYVAVILITKFVKVNGEELAWYYQLILFLVPYIIISYEVIWESIKGIIHLDFLNETFLMTIASIAALAIGEHMEAVAVMLFFAIGELFEHIAVGKSRRSISSLVEMAPKIAVVLRDGEWVEVDPSELAIGDTILIKNGDKVPVDSIITKGKTYLDFSALTGESVPVSRGEGEEILSGGINQGDAIEAKVKAIYEDSAVSRILNMVEEASDKKSKQETFITKFARVYTPVVVGSAIALFIIGGAVTGNWIEWLRRAVMFLVVSCPCAFVLAVPLCFFGGIGSAAKQGILVKGSNYLELLNKCKIFYTDKTGTITKGDFVVQEFKVYGEEDRKEALEIICSMEQYSSHPIAKAILQYAKENNIELRDLSVSEIGGKGLSYEEYRLGNLNYIKEVVSDIDDEISIGTCVYLSKGNKLVARVIIADEIKESSIEACKALNDMGCELRMLTGDNEAIAKAVSDTVGIKSYNANLLPEDKVKVVDNAILSTDKGKTVAYIGDGINDAPSLRRADIGIAMGGIGSQAAIESADMVLVKDDLSTLVSAKKIARRTMITVLINIIFALTVKISILILSAIGLGNIWLSIFGDTGVTIIAVFIAMTNLLKKK